MALLRQRKGQIVPKYVAFLRGINVGGNCKIPMADLRLLCAGITSDPGVRSYIGSGNLVFSATEPLADQIAGGIKDRFGFDVPIVVLAASEMRQVLADCPYAGAAGNTVHGYLCLETPTVDRVKIDSLKAPTEQVSVMGRTVWLFAPDGVGRSKLAAKMETCIGPATARNLNTLIKMVEMLEN